MVYREPDIEVGSAQFFFEEMLRVRTHKNLLEPFLEPFVDKLVFKRGKLNVIVAIEIYDIRACCEVSDDVNTCYKRWLFRKVLE